MTERTEALAAAADDERNQRERRTAILHALRAASREGGTVPPSLLKHFASRLDGTPATVRDTTPDTPATSTNNADGITHAPTPLSGRNED